MSINDRKRLDRGRKVITSSMEFTKPCYSLEAAFQSSAKNTCVLADQTASTFINRERLSNLEDILEVKKTPMVFVGISKPSPAVDRLLAKRKTDHENAVKNMRDELAAGYAACEEEFKNRSISVKIKINEIRGGIEKERHKLREINLFELRSEDFDLAWVKVSALIQDEKEIVDHFNNQLLIIEKKRQKCSKSILQKYYKTFHKICFLLPYEIQVYFEDEILNYNEAVLGNHRTYADLHLQMRLLADTEKIRFKDWIEELKIDSKEATRQDISNN